MKEFPKGWMSEQFKEAAEAVKKMPKEEREFYEQLFNYAPNTPT